MVRGRGRGAGEGDTGKRRVGEGHRPEGRPVGGGELQHRGGTPASCNSRVIACATRGVAGRLCHHALPAARAAVIWPVNIASGKFHGLMHTNTPRPCSDERVALTRRATQSPGHRTARAAGRVVATEVHRFAQFRHCIRQRLARFAHQQAQKLPRRASSSIRRPLKAGGALAAGSASQAGCARAASSWPAAISAAVASRVRAHDLAGIGRGC